MNSRDEKGRFTKGNQVAKGNSGGPGRPKKAREERYHEILQTTCTFTEWRKVVKKALEQAQRGNHQARKFLADYLIGPPPQRHELTGEGGGSIMLGYSGNVDPDDDL